MHKELTNLLPYARQKALFRWYIVRVVVVGAVLVNVTMIASAILLFPTYILLTGNEKASETRLASLQLALGSSNEKEVLARVTLLTDQAGALAQLGTTPTVSEVIRSVLAVPHAGIAITGFTYSPQTAKTQRTLDVVGTASTRETVRSYQLALQSVPGVRSAALPLSAYAKDSSIPFTISLTLTP